MLRSHAGSLWSAVFSSDGTRIAAAAENDNSVHIFDASSAMISVQDLITEVCTRRLLGIAVMTHVAMRLVGYPDTKPEIDVAAGLKGTN